MGRMRTTLSLILTLMTATLTLQASDSLISTQIIAFKEISPNESLILKRYGPSGQA